ncbi:unnamed protein product [Owenia fusiformis]|uniref:Uncharacterized protein n=1 Tax=Owenia fusiformis TaxID=6347 RepID=A0A8J1XQG6_OWEFU|nr:unnamed protein product [Owenia fusiformis]
MEWSTLIIGFTLFSQAYGFFPRFGPRLIRVDTPPPPEFPEPRCYQALSPGPCYASKPRWFYNSDTAECQPFVFGGCAGNDNNFQTVDECVKSCIGHRDVTEDDGNDGPFGIPRGSPITSFPKITPIDMSHRSFLGEKLLKLRLGALYESGAFDPQQNLNEGLPEMPSFQTNVPNELEWRNRRPVKQNVKISITQFRPNFYHRPNLPQLPSLPVVHPEHQPFGPPPPPPHILLSQFHNEYPEEQEMPESVPEIDPEPEVNPKSTNEKLKPQNPSYPGETMKIICSMAKDSGPCSAKHNMWYYNSQSAKCELFQYGGCGGNLNRFYRDEDCLTACRSALPLVNKDANTEKEKEPIISDNKAAKDEPLTTEENDNSEGIPKEIISVKATEMEYVTMIIVMAIVGVLMITISVFVMMILFRRLHQTKTKKEKILETMVRDHLNLNLYSDLPTLPKVHTFATPYDNATEENKINKITHDANEKSTSIA